MRAEDGQTIGAFDQLHRSRPARVHFDRVRNAVSRDEIHAVDADQFELLSNRPRERPRRADKSVVTGELRVASRSQNAPAVLEPRRAKGWSSGELSRDA